jgi:hypothetical protein
VRFAFHQKLGDSEVQQPHMTVAVHQNVRGLQVAVDDQARMRVLHGAQHIQEQLEPLLQSQRLPSQ